MGRREHLVPAVADEVQLTAAFRERGQLMGGLETGADPRGGALRTESGIRDTGAP
ncbi:hypothetical protein [Streptomyces tsukubensis]|uniref:hypothetical protein n=1 Tax=Streptomyces tsukubensis TaxID=83656 RepID=UPI0015C2FBEB|nr:hypothetical protein [Streptomyces tsukubensis]